MEGGASMATPLTTAGVDYSNETSVFNFQQLVLDDSELQVIGNAFARYFWYRVVVVVGIATIFNFTRRVTLAMRLKTAARGRATPARPKRLVMRYLATVTAICRESTYYHFTPTTYPRLLSVPPVGTILLLLVYLGFVLGLQFTDNNVPGAQHYQALGLRAAWLGVAQVPLLILLIGKNNLIGLATGVSYERLNVLHRWVARMFLLLITLHMGYQNYGWTLYGTRQVEWTTDTCPPTGIAAYSILLWINLSTLAPIRNWSYEFFVVQHIITFFGLIIAIMLHLPSTAYYSRVWIYIPIALYLVDRVVRSLWYASINIRLSKATLTAMDGGVTKIRISNPALKHWRPGSHVLLSIPRLRFGENHPATILSTPRSHNGDLVFLLKSQKGFTKTIMTSANSSTAAILPNTKQEADASPQVTSYYTLLDGPYGGSQSDFAAFDSICLIAGSTGITFILGILQNIADRTVDGKRLPVRRIHLVWCTKDTSWMRWCNKELAAAVSQLECAGIKAEISVYVTCADLVTDDGGQKHYDCACDKSLGPCSCIRVDGNGDNEPDSIKPAKRDIEQGATNIEEKGLAPRTTSNSSILKGKVSAFKSNTLPCADFFSGRPDFRQILTTLLEGADGESGVTVCGPLGLSSSVRNTVVRLSDQRAVHKGTGAQGIYLHVEGFGQ